MATIGFIGLGNMGAPMAANLVKAGHRVTGFDVVSKAVESLAAKGGTAAASAPVAAAGSEIVITMLPAGPQVRSVYLGEDGLLAHAPKDALLIDCSTIDVETARAVAAAAAEAGFDMLDAPVSGGVGRRGGDPHLHGRRRGGVFSRAQPILVRMGGRSSMPAGRQRPGGEDLQQHDARRLDDRGVRGLSLPSGWARGADIVRHQRQIFRPMLALTSYCPVPGPVPASPANRDYAPGLHRCDDAEGSTIGTASGGCECGADPARSGGGQPLPAVCRRGRGRARFLSNLSLHSQARG